MENRSRLPIFILIGVLVILLMIPISAILINPMESDPLNTPIFELGDMSLNEMFGTDHLDDEFNALNDYTINELFNLTSYFDSEQLVTNGDFSDETNTWLANNATLNEIDQNIIANGLSGSVNVGISKTSGFSTLNANKYYYITSIRTLSTEATQLRLRTYNPTPSDISIMTPIINEWYQLSVIRTNTNNAIGIDIYATYSVTATNKQFEIDYVYAFNLTSLINNLYYSPLYDTTFDLMNDTQIKTQMEDFVSYPYKFIDYATLGVEITDDQWDFLNNYYTDWYAFDTDLYMFLYAGLSLTADQWQYYYNLYTYYSSL